MHGGVRAPAILSNVYILDICFLLPAFAITAVMLSRKSALASPFNSGAAHHGIHAERFCRVHRNPSTPLQPDMDQTERIAVWFLHAGVHPARCLLFQEFEVWGSGVMRFGSSRCVDVGRTAASARR